MPIDLSELEHRNDFDLETKVLGFVRCGALTMRATTKLQKHLDDQKTTGPAFVRALLALVGTTQAEEDEEPKNLSQEDIDQFSANEIETFSDLFLAHHQYLFNSYEDAEWEEHKNEKGERVASVTPKPIDLEKQEDEANSDYLFRVFRRYMEEQSRRMKNIMKPITSLIPKDLFSLPTQELLRRNFMLSDRLRETIGSIQKAFPKTNIGTEIRPVSPLKTPQIENPTVETNRRLNRVLDHIEDVRPLISQSAELIGNLNDAAIQMITDFGRNARRTQIFTLIVIGIAVASLAITAFFSWWSFSDTQIRSDEAARQSRTQRTQIEQLTTSQNERLKQLIRTFQEDSERLSRENRQAIVSVIEALRVDSREQTTNRRQEFIDTLAEALSRLPREAPPR